MEQLFCVVSRSKDNRTRATLCDDFIVAAATQLGQLVGIPAADARQMIAKEDLIRIKNNIAKSGKDRISNEKTEVYIFYIPKWR